MGGDREQAGAVEERIELRAASGTLLGVLITGAQRLEFKKGSRLFEVDLTALNQGRAVVFERVLHPEPCARMDADNNG